MKTKYFSPIKKWVIPEMCLSASIEDLSLDGKDGNEGIVLWLGRRNQGFATVTYIVILRGPGIKKEPDYLQVEPRLINEVAIRASECNTILVGQIHSHGPFYGTDLSPSDRLNGIAVPYYLSVVAPDYGLRVDTKLADCGVHIYQRESGFQRLSQTEIKKRIQIIPIDRLEA